MTTDDTFEHAIARTGIEEARFNGARFMRGIQPQLLEVRGPSARRVSGKAASEVPVQVVMSLPAGALGSPPAPFSKD